MTPRILRSLKNAILPKGRAFRRLRYGPAAGCTMMIDYQTDLRLYLGMYEKELEPHFRALTRTGYKSFDVGGRGGYDALMISKLTGNGPVVSFECEHDAADEMRATFTQNTLPIETIETFVGAHTDDTHLTLDDAASRTFTPDFIKIDVEGAEADALEGASTILSTRKPHMIIEIHGADVEARCLETLKSHGYSPQIIEQRSWMKEHRPLAFNRWLICRGNE